MAKLAIVFNGDCMKTPRQFLIDYYMDNPSLSCDEDYLPNEDRLIYYTQLVADMTNDEVLTETQMIKD